MMQVKTKVFGRGRYKMVTKKVFNNLRYAALFGIVLIAASCTPTAEVKEPPQDVVQNPTPDEIICKYNKEILGLPKKFKTFGALDEINASRDPRLVGSIEEDKKTILALNTKHICTCGTTVEKEKAKCASITSG